MNTEEKRTLLVEKALSRREKNEYSQRADRRTKIEEGYGDCSGTVWYWYNKLFGMNIGANTEAQLKSPLGERVSLTITDGIPDESKMKPGDLLYFRGVDNSRTEGVGHVEMYIGSGKIFGHGSGIGGTVKSLKGYCSARQHSSSTEKLKNRGLICVKRFLKEENRVTELTEINDIVWELAHRGIVTDSDLWLDKLQNDTNAYWLARKTLHALRLEEEKNA